MREKYSLALEKTIYERLPYPSNKGGFEKAFMEYVDEDALTEAFIKIQEYKHTFAHIVYIRSDGLLSFYYPDFLVKTKNKIYLVETKAEKDKTTPNVKQKQIATLKWIEKINKLDPKDRMDRKWEYILLGENSFYSLKNNGASIEEILEHSKATEKEIKRRISGTLF